MEENQFSRAHSDCSTTEREWANNALAYFARMEEIGMLSNNASEKVNTKAVSCTYKIIYCANIVQIQDKLKHCIYFLILNIEMNIESKKFNVFYSII